MSKAAISGVTVLLLSLGFSVLAVSVYSQLLDNADVILSSEPASARSYEQTLDRES
jgi:CRISPR/Cas system-associated protein endoribonuclease Cas2